MSQPSDARPGNGGAPGAAHDAMPGPPDVFLSYAHDDQNRVAPVIQLLAGQGWFVWSDHRLVGGQVWQQEIDAALRGARCVVVLWSEASTASNWVKDEASEGMRRGVLVPVLLDDVEIPLGFRQVQALDWWRRPDASNREGALVAAVARILGRPAGAPRPPPRWGRVKAWGPALAAVAPLALALPFLLAPARQAEIDLDVRATQVDFEAAREQEVTDLVVATVVEAEGLESIRLPRTRAEPERRLQAGGGRDLTLALASDGGADAGSLTLPALVVAEGSQVTVAAADAGRVQVAVQGSTLEFAVNVEGVVRMALPQTEMRLVDFGAPKPILLQPDERGATLSFRRADGERRLLPGPLAVRSLSLTRIDESITAQRTDVRLLSTIVSGTLQFDPPNGVERSLGPAERLGFSESSGEIRALELADGELLVRFRGRVRALQSCSLEGCESWMPTTLQSLAVRRPGWLIALPAAYLLLLLGLARRRRSPSRVAMIGAVACGLCAAAPARAQVNSPLSDPEESIKQLVVRVETELGFGSGIIAGDRSDTIYIVTANHVVRRGAQTAEQVDLRFRWLPDRPIAGRLLPRSDDALDLAVISVDAADLPIDARALPYDRLGDLGSLDRGDPIYLLGHPNGLPWRVNTVAERFIEARGESLDFESNLVARGHSGGALLDEDRRLLGMLKSDQPPYGEAVSIHAIARMLETWDYPARWRLPPPQLAAGSGRTCVLTAAGETRCWGYDPRFETGPIVVDLPLKSLSGRDDHVCGLAEGGRAFCAGNNAQGQLGDGTTVYRDGVPAAVVGGLTFDSISAGVGHTCAVTTDGEVYCWGLADSGQLGLGWEAPESPTPVRVPAPERFESVGTAWGYTCGLTPAGALYCWGGVAANFLFEDAPITRFARDVSFASISTGWYHVCGIAATGGALCLGFNDDGQLGVGEADDGFSEAPRPVAGNHAFRSLSAGLSHTCGVTTGGEGYCWGLNSHGQLGDGTTTTRPAPVRVSGGLIFESISAGSLHTCGLTVEGEVYCWGEAEGGEVELPDQLQPLRVMSLPPDERIPWGR